MNNNYKKDLMNQYVSLEDLAKKYPVPTLLYKYKNFDDNGYWKKAVTGEFHLSRAESFEDKDDCKPKINLQAMLNFCVEIVEDLTGCSISETNKKLLNTELSEINSQDCIKEIQQKFQHNIRIGCFTDSECKEKMWEKYSAKGTGFCIEFDTSKNILTHNLIHAVIYTDNDYDVSRAVAISNLLDIIKNYPAKYPYYLELLRNITYKCLYIKSPEWSFEEEYRLIFPDHIMTTSGEIKATDYVFGQDNVDLSDCVKTVYIGRNFKTLPNHEEILNEVKSLTICKEIKVKFI